MDFSAGEAFAQFAKKRRGQNQTADAEKLDDQQLLHMIGVHVRRRRDHFGWYVQKPANYTAEDFFDVLKRRQADAFAFIKVMQ